MSDKINVINIYKNKKDTTPVVSLLSIDFFLNMLLLLGYVITITWIDMVQTTRVPKISTKPTDDKICLIS